MTDNQNVKDVLDLIADGAKTTEDILADKKVTFIEAFQFAPILMRIPGVIPKFTLAKDELLNADDESRADIISYAQSNFDLASDKAEKVMEHLVGVLTHGAGLYTAFSS